MKYTTEDLEKDISEIVKKLAGLRKAKGHDYAGDDDTFSDLRPLGVDYCLKRIIQKCFRALNLLKHPPAVKDEKIEQEFGDIINFAVYSPILHQQIQNSYPDMVFYPHYCTSCHLPFLSKDELSCCPYCKGVETVNHKRQCYGEEIKCTPSDVKTESTEQPAVKKPGLTSIYTNSGQTPVLGISAGSATKDGTDGRNGK